MLKPFHVDAVFADLRPEGTRIEAEEFGSAVLSGDFAVGAVERLDDIIDGDLVECLKWFRIVLVPLCCSAPACSLGTGGQKRGRKNFRKGCSGNYR